MPDNQPTEVILKRFEFKAVVNKVWKDTSSGTEKYYLKAIASDTGVDWYGERFSEDALTGMVNCIKNNSPAPVILLPTHWDTFEIGKATDGTVINSPTHDSLKALEVTFELDMEYPQAKSLYNEVESGDAQKQLSVGGYLNPDNENSYFWERKEYETDDGNVFVDYLLVLNDLILDHVAVTRKDHAANPRTGFLDAVAKSRIQKPELPLTNKGVGEMPTAGEKPVNQGLLDSILRGVKDAFHKSSTDERATKLAALKKSLTDATAIAKDIGEFSDADVTTLDNPEFKELMNAILSNTEEASESSTAEGAEDGSIGDKLETTGSEEAVNTDQGASDPLKTTTDAPAAQSTPAVDVDALKSTIVSEVTKSLNESNIATFQEIAKSIGDILGETLKSALAPVEKRLSEIENFSGKSKALDGQENLADTKTKSTEADGTESVWGGILKGAIPEYVIAEKKFEMQSE
jgi:hypothetical protein